MCQSKQTEAILSQQIKQEVTWHQSLCRTGRQKNICCCLLFQLERLCKKTTTGSRDPSDWKWPDSCSKEQNGKPIVLEQNLRMLHPDIHTWIKEHNPQTGDEQQTWQNTTQPTQWDPLKKRSLLESWGLVRSNLTIWVLDKTDTVFVYSNLKPNLLCYCCQKPGHKVSLCPLRKSKTVQLCTSSRKWWPW